MAARPELTPVTPYCSIERALVLLQDRWSFLILREVLMYRRERFGDIRDALGIATNILTDRLDRLVEGGILERGGYRTAGSRTRPSYHPTAAGLALALPLAALQQWGDEFEPRADGPTVVRRRAATGEPARVAFVAPGGDVLAVEDVEFLPTEAYPGRAVDARE